MPVTDVRKDIATLTMTVVSEWGAPIGAVWQLWADPRKLERWWGPPTYPATVVEHDLSRGGKVSYLMTGPQGDQHRGWWKVLDVQDLQRLELQDGFSEPDGTPSESMPTTLVSVSFAELPGERTRMVIDTIFASLESMSQLIEMGMEEGLAAAMSQIDEILALS